MLDVTTLLFFWMRHAFVCPKQSRSGIHSQYFHKWTNNQLSPKTTIHHGNTPSDIYVTRPGSLINQLSGDDFASYTKVRLPKSIGDVIIERVYSAYR
jgi:hypothetical protein